MNISIIKRFGATALSATLFAVVAACAPKVATVAPPPPAPIPQKPYPPVGAAPNLTTPPLLADGTRLSVNYGVSPEQAAWNLRSAYNVAALNCMSPEHTPILANYAEFLKSYRKQLGVVNKSLEKTFKEKHGSSYLRVREAYQTQVYNYFALPPVIPAFCNAALALAEEMRQAPPTDIVAFAPTGLAKLEMVYADFFNRYDKYRSDLAAWNAAYGPPGMTAPVTAYAAPLLSPVVATTSATTAPVGAYGAAPLSPVVSTTPAATATVDAYGAPPLSSVVTETPVTPGTISAYGAPSLSPVVTETPAPLAPQ